MVAMDFQSGDLVRSETHLSWGIGQIVNLFVDKSGNEDVEVVFSKAREKKLRLGLAKLIKPESTESAVDQLKREFAESFKRP